MSAWGIGATTATRRGLGVRRAGADSATVEPPVPSIDTLVTWIPGEVVTAMPRSSSPCSPKGQAVASRRLRSHGAGGCSPDSSSRLCSHGSADGPSPPIRQEVKAGANGARRGSGRRVSDMESRRTRLMVVLNQVDRRQSVGRSAVVGLIAPYSPCSQKAPCAVWVGSPSDQEAPEAPEARVGSDLKANLCLLLCLFGGFAEKAPRGGRSESVRAGVLASLRLRASGPANALHCSQKTV